MDHHYFEYFFDIPFPDYGCSDETIAIVRNMTLDDKEELFRLMRENPVCFNYAPKHFIEDNEICDFVLSRMDSQAQKMFLEHRHIELHGKLRSDMSEDGVAKRKAELIKI
jgi:hypothetical protein